MNMRWIVAHNIDWRVLRMMDYGMAPLVDRPGFRRAARMGVSSAQTWPPNLLKPAFPEHRIDRAHDKTTNAVVILHDKSKIRLERGVRG